jgi:hypothetical protein
MKNDLIITRFKTEPVVGTKSIYEHKTYFGSKMIDIEDNIIVDDSSIQYSEMYNPLDPVKNDGSLLANYPNNNGFQNLIDYDDRESIYLINLSNIKNDNHNIILLSQTLTDLKYNTNWNIIINWKDILMEYIFYKLKNARTFKCVRYSDVEGQNINLYIRKYIDKNILNRYQFTKLNLYIEYVSLNNTNIDKEPNYSFNPKYDSTIKNEKKLIKNVNATIMDKTISVNYKQTETSINQSFKYYFDVILTKI